MCIRDSSNAAPENLKGKLSGVDIYYSPVSYLGKMFAEMLAENYKTIYLSLIHI